ncbi:MAG: peptidylprolyl isomerase [Alphaproteobacteria bacterium MedPE-SWcel]|nr:MAG: peptidylprolyl isomerase [Alphaproteobacteria bacterium MedPE-SWcel]
MTAVKNGDTVRIHYTGKLTDGTVFDSSEGRDPLEFTVGEGHVIKGMDDGMVDMAAGDKKTLEIACEDAYGPINPDARQAIPREGIPDDIPLEIGTMLQMQTPEGQVLPVTVVEVEEATVTLDANHRLAGQDLIFDVELVEIA